MILRSATGILKGLLQNFPAVGIIGPRQVGKTTLSKQLITGFDKQLYLDLENPEDLTKLTEPLIYLRNFADHCIVLDEIQRKPELFPLLRSLIDEDRRPGRFLILGSAAPELLRQSSESLAGRIAYFELAPIILTEIDPNLHLQLWVRGGFPDSFLAKSDETSHQWRTQFIRTYVERDLPMLGLTGDRSQIFNLLTMIAGHPGQTWNASSMAGSLGVTAPTSSKYLSFFKDAFLVDIIRPYFSNIKKRLVKAPKVYLKDSGIAHNLSNIRTYDQLVGHHTVGLSWESYVIQQIKNVCREEFHYYFYRTQHGAEADLILVRGSEVEYCIEIKFTNAPKISKGFLQVIEDLQPKNNFVITPGSDQFPIRENIQVISLGEFLKLSNLQK